MAAVTEIISTYIRRRVKRGRWSTWEEFSRMLSACSNISSWFGRI